jgi:ATP-dependent DNA ligase
MLSTLFHRHGWLFEIEWDGYRAIAEVDKGQARPYSRDGLSSTKRYWRAGVLCVVRRQFAQTAYQRGLTGRMSACLGRLCSVPP